MMNIEVTHNETDLTRDLYGFGFDTQRGFVLTEYRQQTRATKRHKWTGERWHASYQRETGLHSRPTFR